MSNASNQKVSDNVLSLVNDFYLRTASDYEGLSRGIVVLHSLVCLAMFTIVVGMGLAVYYEYHKLNFILATLFLLVNHFFKTTSFLSVVKSVYEEELNIFTKMSSQENDDDLTKIVRKVVRKYLCDKKKQTQTLLEQVS